MTLLTLQVLVFFALVIWMFVTGLRVSALERESRRDGKLQLETNEKMHALLKQLEKDTTRLEDRTGAKPKASGKTLAE